MKRSKCSRSTLSRVARLAASASAAWATRRGLAAMRIIEILRRRDAVSNRLAWAGSIGNRFARYWLGFRTTVVASGGAVADQISHLSAKRISRLQRPETSHGTWRIEVPVIVRKPNEISDLEVGGPDAA